MTAAIPELTTPRLILRPLSLDDTDTVQRLFPRIEVVRFLASRVPWPYPADGAFTFLRDVVLPSMEAGTEWHWSIRLKTAPDQLIGMINVRDSSDDNRGFWLDPAWHGQGLMTEASDAVTDSGSTPCSGPCCASSRPSPTPLRAGFRKRPACA
jgi:ribosomal-protein-alanine N-acetyltransferase